MKRATTSQKQRALAAAVAVALPCLLGCAQIAGTADYEVLVEPKAAPPPPFLTGSEQCEACAADKCGKRLAACDADEVCSSWLSDLRARPDPASAYERYKIENDLFWHYEHDGYGASYEAINSLKKCSGECLDACPLGQNFACVGDFDWDLPQPSRLRARVSELGNGLPTSVLACLDVDQCEVPLASEQTDEAGFTELRFESDVSQRGPVGYLRFQGEGAHSLPLQYSQTRPFGDDDYLPIGLPNDNIIRFWVDGFGQSLDGDHGLLLLLPVDCSGMYAKQVSLEAWSYVGNQPRYCEECSYAYAQDSTEVPGKDLKGMLTAGRTGYIANVPPGAISIVARRLMEPQDVVSVARLVVRGGELAMARLYPASQRDVLLFSDPRK
jgi:hypothetical protein